MKTLGQIAFEAKYAEAMKPPRWEDLENWAQHDWAMAAQAVRAAVIEECAKACEAKADEYLGTLAGGDLCEVCADMLRALKDKK